MVVNNLYFKRIGLHPAETDPPLAVDPNAVLTRPIASQGLETVSRNRAAIPWNFRLNSRPNTLSVSLSRKDRITVPAYYRPELNARRQTGSQGGLLQER
jgi:hypothetical protein